MNGEGGILVPGRGLVAPARRLLGQPSVLLGYEASGLLLQ